MGKSEWIGRLLTDSVFGQHQMSLIVPELKGLLKAGVAEHKAGRVESAVYVFKQIWYWCVRNLDSPKKLGDRAESLLGALLKCDVNAETAISTLKWKYGIHMQNGEPWKALNTLDVCAARVESGALRDDYVCAVDQKAVTLTELGRPNEAERMHREALRVADRERLFRRQQISAGNLAECLRRLGRLKAAIKISYRSLKLHDPSKDPAGYVAALHTHYLIELGLKHFASAEKSLLKCESTARHHGLFKESVARSWHVRIGNGNKAQLGAAIGSFKRALLNLRNSVKLRTWPPAVGTTWRFSFVEQGIWEERCEY